MIDVESTIISQYDKAATIRELINNMNEYISPTADIAEFYNRVFNIDTATGFGLDIWGRIVGVNRVVKISSTLPYFGLYGTQRTFYQRVLYSGNKPTSNYPLDDALYRRVIMLKALSNITIPSVFGINQLLKNFFPGRGNPHVVDNQDMTMSYAFDFTLTPAETGIVYYSGVFPRPSGVDDGLQPALPRSHIFGFNPNGSATNFFQARFYTSN